MGKNMNFSGQPIFNQLLNFIDKNEIKQIAKKHEAERYVKKFRTYHHLVVMLYASIKGCKELAQKTKFYQLDELRGILSV